MNTYIRKTITCTFGLSLIAFQLFAYADSSVVAVSKPDESRIAYLLVKKNDAPKYTIIGFPGGIGILNARAHESEIKFQMKGHL